MQQVAARKMEWIGNRLVRIDEAQRLDPPPRAPAAPESHESHGSPWSLPGPPREALWRRRLPAPANRSLPRPSPTAHFAHRGPHGVHNYLQSTYLQPAPTTDLPLFSAFCDGKQPCNCTPSGKSNANAFVYTEHNLCSLNYPQSSTRLMIQREIAPTAPIDPPANTSCKTCFVTPNNPSCSRHLQREK